MIASDFVVTMYVDHEDALLVASGELDAFVPIDMAVDLDALPPTVRTVEVDLAGVTFIDAGGIGMLMRVSQAAADRAATLTFSGAGDYVRVICTLAGVAAALGIEPRAGASRTPAPRR
jgi:ABC-type transporter Mla MlaB component